MKLDISEDALGDLDEILSFSIRQWGPARAFDYIADIRAKAEALARGDLSGGEGRRDRPGPAAAEGGRAGELVPGGGGAAPGDPGAASEPGRGTVGGVISVR